MAKTNAAPQGPGRRARALPFLHHRTTHRFFRLLGATTTKTARRRRRLTARPTHSRRVARPGAPERKRPEAAAEPKEKAFGAARDPDAAADAAMVAGKYWAHRHSLFSLYDRGVRMDAEGWYSATPESVAAAQAARPATSSSTPSPAAAATPSSSPPGALPRRRRGDRAPEGGARGAQRQDLRRRGQDPVRGRRLLPAGAVPQGTTGTATISFFFTDSSVDQDTPVYQLRGFCEGF